MGEQQDRADEDVAARLPEDVVADVLHRLEPRWLAASRCVCKAWRTVIDSRSLLRTDLLPLSLGGIFIDFGNIFTFSEFFSRPASSPGDAMLSGKVDFLPLDIDLSEGMRFNDYVVRDHCNGLVLANNYVVNPATQRWDPLPVPPLDYYFQETAFLFDVPPLDHYFQETAFLFDEYLVFDPTVSPHYMVFMIRRLGTEDLNHLVEKSEWPPSPFILLVFSSSSGRWEERSFVRQGNAAGNVDTSYGSLRRLFSVYWRGSLYVHSQNFVMRIFLSEDKYSVIELPVTIREDHGYDSYLGRSENGVYLASVSKVGLHVWILKESCGQLEWMLKCVFGLKFMPVFNRQVLGPWILQDNNYDFYRDRLPLANKEAIFQEKSEWNSDDDDFYDNGDMFEVSGRLWEIEILGFHPFKEIIFMSISMNYKLMATGLAYHLNSSKVEVLGSIYPTHYNHFDIQVGLPDSERPIGYSFPYTPCWMGEFPRNSKAIS